MIYIWYYKKNINTASSILNFFFLQVKKKKKQHIELNIPGLNLGGAPFTSSDVTQSLYQTSSSQENIHVSEGVWRTEGLALAICGYS